MVDVVCMWFVRGVVYISLVLYCYILARPPGVIPWCAICPSLSCLIMHSVYHFYFLAPIPLRTVVCIANLRSLEQRLHYFNVISLYSVLCGSVCKLETWLRHVKNISSLQEAKEELADIIRSDSDNRRSDMKTGASFYSGDYVKPGSHLLQRQIY